MQAAQAGHANVVQRLLAAGASPSMRDADRRTALALAEQARHATVVEILESRKGNWSSFFDF
jgi:ankyrin repeat protein